VKLLSFAGSRGILCLSGLLAAVVLPFGLGSEPAKPWTVEAHMKEVGCASALEEASSPALVEVTSLLRVALAMNPSESILAAVSEVLDKTYGDRVQESVDGMTYVMLLINGIWCRFCVVEGSFEVDFGSKGTVVVDVRQRESSPTIQTSAEPELAALQR
jgi:hypothetical protein